jgi:hypothetical protein
MRLGIVVLSLCGGVLAACTAPANGPRAPAQAGENRPPSSFTFSSRSLTDGHDADDPAAEAGRRDEIAQRLRTLGMCPKGYTITSRRVIIQMGEKDQIDYEARCVT